MIKFISHSRVQESEAINKKTKAVKEKVSNVHLM